MTALESFDRAAPVVQAWIDVGPDDPQAFSAFAIARTRLAGGGALAALERRRLIEVRGSAARGEDFAQRLHASTQFYNPHKERCTLRSDAAALAPVPRDARLALVWERGGERRPAAERWWREEAGETVEVREGMVWVMRFHEGASPETAADELARVRDARHGVLAHPWSQELRLAGTTPPLPWIEIQPDSGAPLA